MPNVKQKIFGTIFASGGMLTGTKFGYELIKMVKQETWGVASRDPYFWITAGAGVLSVMGAVCLALDYLYFKENVTVAGNAAVYSGGGLGGDPRGNGHRGYHGRQDKHNRSKGGSPHNPSSPLLLPLAANSPSGTQSASSVSRSYISPR